MFKQFKTELLGLLNEDYSGSCSENTAKVSVTSTPVGAFFSIIRIAYACTVLINRFHLRNHTRDTCQVFYSCDNCRELKMSKFGKK
ncbi:hypothetical protein BpHYR1_000849 [Brachionus plicatilis]|uniref:Uncharacterized protein n=1 Tax=Brachionus plicatilis TaxID=10195 RepID=A0A3M7RBD3_BRAPC|nr:hypothetical protein BpHYR1_000849 [Brachionus plicatilis]